MKPKLKYILVAIAAIILFCGFKYSNREGFDFSDTEQMEILYYQGHSYICYKWRHGGNAASVGGASITHDPDCRCGKGGGR